MTHAEQHAQSFLAPITGRTTTFLIESRQANLSFARVFMGLLVQAETACAVVDLDAFYSSNSDLIFLSPGSPFAEQAIISVPAPGANLEREFSSLFEVEQRVVVIDSLNTLYHLISQEDGSSRSRKLAFAIASLSYLARTNEKAVILSMYRREGFSRGGTGRSISSLTDGTVSVDIRGQEMILRNERGTGWPGGRLSIRIP